MSNDKRNNLLTFNSTAVDKSLYLSLVHAYAKELAEIEHNMPGNEFELNVMYISFLNTDNIECHKLINSDNDFVGFVLLESLKADSTAPFDCFIMESYVAPKSRKQGLLKNEVEKYIADNSIKSFGYVVLKHNHNADDYWKKFFSENGFEIERCNKTFPSKFKGCKCYIARKSY